MTLPQLRRRITVRHSNGMDSGMRAFALISILALAACTNSVGPQGGGSKAPGSADASRLDSEPRPASHPQPSPDAQPGVAAETNHGLFAGSWQSCDTASPEECSRYLLAQRGDRICGTWSYVATGDHYEGRLIAEAFSASAARRRRICGRPGSETQTECEDGWETIDKPLHVCDGSLGDLEGKAGACFADFERVSDDAQALAALSEQPWMKACLRR
jgi:hypothetical protein